MRNIQTSLPVMTQPTIQQTFDRAVQHHRAGQLPEAEQLYREILATRPEHSQALHFLGMVLHQSGQRDIAVDLIRRAVALEPGLTEAHFNLGFALIDSGKFDEAIAPLRQAIALRPDYAQAHFNLGIALKSTGRIDEAIAAFRQTIALWPTYAQAHRSLGNALKESGKLDDAIAALRQAISADPDLPEAHNDLGMALSAKGRCEEAIAALRNAIALKPDYPEAHNNLGNAFRSARQLREAHLAFRQAILLKPDFIEARINLGAVLREGGRLDDALAAARQTIALRPTSPDSHNNLGNILKDQGQVEEAIAAYRRAIDLQPTYAEDHSNLILALHYSPTHDAESIAGELRRWNQQNAQPLKKFIQPHSNDPTPDRPLRIGYVSPDFRTHPVGRNLLPLFRHHNRQLFEITAYSNVLHPDATTPQFQQCADRWRNIVGLTDQQVADQIREDRIDILIDLSLHTAHNRLLVFALKPAPVQASYLGYPGSTGLDTIDYRISDPYIDPPGSDDSHYTEKTIRLSKTYWCYQPGADPTLLPAPSPALTNGYVTFGCQNNYCKISPAAWNTWSAILKTLPDSKLLVYSARGKHREKARNILANTGLDPDRLHFSESFGPEYFRCYNQIDIALDPFPFCGGTTTCDALWMGVPVITLWGQTAVGRGGRSTLSNLGLHEFIAATPDHYLQIAVDLARDLPRMESLRRGMRSRMQNSPLMDEPGFTQDMESLYRRMWHTWCDTATKSSRP
ncbi:MAG: tetratricopeptide repeat protein [Tepidisphaeraceae bacterium]